MPDIYLINTAKGSVTRVVSEEMFMELGYIRDRAKEDSKNFGIYTKKLNDYYTMVIYLTCDPFEVDRARKGIHNEFDDGLSLTYEEMCACTKAMSELKELRAALLSTSTFKSITMFSKLGYSFITKNLRP